MPNILTVQTVKNIKRGSWITFYNGIYAMIMGIVYIFFINAIIKMNFRAIDAVWQVFSKYNPELSGMIIRILVLKGFLVFAIGVAIVYLSNYIIKKKDKSAWVVLFIIGLVFWGVLLTVEALDGNIYTIVAASIGWLTFIIGMLMPMKYYLQKEYIEY
jgi:hypothetical protein